MDKHSNKQHFCIPLLHHQQGINLIEIMVAMTIGLFLVLGATTLYVNSKKTADVDDSIARLQETARYAMSIIESDVRVANYWGLSNHGYKIRNNDSANTITCPSYAYATNTKNYIEASNNSKNINDTGSSCTIKSTAASAADILTVRRAAVSTASTNSSKLQICTTRSTSSIMKRSSPSCQGAGAEVHDLLTNIYFIDTQSDQSSSIPSLRRKSLISGPVFQETEVISGIEDLQIELGWDNSQNDELGAVRYLTPDTLPNSGRIVAVRVWLLARAEQADANFTDSRTYSYAGRSGYMPADHYQRLLISKTIFIRNAAGS